MSGLELKVLIVGAGIAGPNCAYWLTRAQPNTHVTIIERAPAPRFAGQAVDIRGSAVEIIRRMGLEDEVRAHHTTETGFALVDRNGRIAAQFDASGDSQRQSITSEYEILRADLAQLLAKQTKNVSNVEYRYGETVESLMQHDNSVDVVFASGRQETFDLIVAADGATSRTRRMILDQSLADSAFKFLGQYIAFFSVPSQPQDGKLWQWYNASRGRMISIRPHKDSSTVGAYLCLTMSSNDKRDPEIEKAMNSANGQSDLKRILRSRFSDAGFEASRLLDGMDECSDFYMGRSCQVKISSWSEGHGVLIGDTATASFGVGTSLALQSGYVLAGELSKITSKRDIPTALQRYEQVLRPLVEKSQRMPPGGLQIANPQTEWGIWIMYTIAWIVSYIKIYRLFQGVGETEWELPEYN